MPSEAEIEAALNARSTKFPYSVRTILNSHGVVYPSQAVAIMEAALSAASAVRSEGVVKALEWEPTRNGDWRASSIIGSYAAGVIGTGYTVILRHYDDDENCDTVIGRGYPRHIEAKAAAQADYEQRILSALQSKKPE